MAPTAPSPARTDVFDSLLKIVTAPLEVVDQLVLKPVAEVAQQVVEAVTPDPDER